MYVRLSCAVVYVHRIEREREVHFRITLSPPRQPRAQCFCLTQTAIKLSGLKQLLVLVERNFPLGDLHSLIAIAIYCADSNRLSSSKLTKCPRKYYSSSSRVCVGELTGKSPPFILGRRVAHVNTSRI